MEPLMIVGWLGTATVLVGYVISVQKRTPLIFHVANFIGSFGVGASAAFLKAWPHLVLTAFFGLIGAWGIYKETRDPKDW